MASRMWCLTLVVSAALTLVCVQAAQRFVKPPRDISVVEKQTAVLTCSIADRKGAVQWTKGGFSLGYNRTIPGFARYSMLTQSEGQFDLMIRNVTLQDDDEYSCQVLPGGGDRPLLARARLTVLVRCEEPEILNRRNSSTLVVSYADESVDLVCEARAGKPAATIEWYRDDGTKLSENIQYTTEDVPVEGIRGAKLETARSTLTVDLTNFREQDGKQYQCQAKNSAVFDRALTTSVELSVLYPPGPPELSGYNGGVLQVGDNLELTCRSHGGNPTGHVIWYRNFQAVDRSFTTGTHQAVNVYTLRVSARDHNAVYSCHVTSEGLPSLATMKANYTLRVEFPPESVTMSGVSQPVRTGRTVTLTCVTALANPKVDVSWFDTNGEINHQHITQTFEESPQGGFVTTSSINVNATAANDGNIYRCRADAVMDTLTLHVLYPPSQVQITGYQEGTVLQAGDYERVICMALGGNPPAELKWYKGDTPRNDASYMQMGTISRSEMAIHVAPNDNGAVYRCQANSTAMTSLMETRITLSVRFPPTQVVITANPQEARVGQQVDLTCHCSSSNPAAVITWTRNGRRESGTNLGTDNAAHGGRKTTNRLRFRATSRDHGAVFGCRATNTFMDRSVNDAVTLNVLFKPEFDIATLPRVVEMKKGERGGINLTAAANPPSVTYDLFKGGHRLNTLPAHFDLSRGILNISRVAKTDKGDYMIKATNAEGVTTFNFSIIVKYPARISSISSLQSVDEGEEVTFTCEADAYPVVRNMFTWFRPGFDASRFRTAQEGNLSTLTISHLRREDAGQFKCTVDNRIGSPSHRSAGLVVKFSPVIDKSPATSRSAGQTGGVVTLRCAAAGAPRVEITWTRNNTQVRDNDKFQVDSSVEGSTYTSLLQINTVTRGDYGAYVCTATNSKGSDSHSITLAGTTKPYPPYNIQVVNATARSITIAWKAGFNGGLAQSFRVRYKPVDARGYVYVDVRPFGALNYKIRGLQMDKEYELTVLAFNDLGESAYQARGITAKTMDKETPADVATSELQGSDETPVIIILVVCIVGVFILTLNVGLILFFIRKRKKRMEGNSDTTSHTNTFELYGSSNKADHNMYPAPPSDDTRSYGTYDKSLDDFSDDYIRDYDRECETHVFLPPTQPGDYPGSRPYSPSHKLHPADSPRLLGGGHKVTTYIEDRPGRVSPWTEDPYKRAQPSHRKGSYENGVPNGDVYEFKSARGKGMNELSERSSSRPPSRSVSSSVLSPNIVANPSYNGPVSTFSNGGPSHRSINNISSTTTASVNHLPPSAAPSSSSRASPSPHKPGNSHNYIASSSGNIHRPPPSPHNTVPAGSEFRGHLV